MEEQDVQTILYKPSLVKFKKTPFPGDCETVNGNLHRLDLT